MRKTFDYCGLSTEAKRRFKEIASEYDIHPDQTAAVLILKAAMEAFDRMRQAQQAIAEHGVVFMDRYGQPRANPAAVVERDSRAAMLRCFKDLDLEIGESDPKKTPGRVCPGYQNRKTSGRLAGGEAKGVYCAMKLLDINQAAQRLAVSPSTIRRMLADDSCPSHNLASLSLLVIGGMISRVAGSPPHSGVRMIAPCASDDTVRFRSNRSHDSSWSSARDSFKSGVSNPSVNQP